MSCIYGKRQLGIEDQGWLAWFIIATLTNKPITIYGNGKQVRDVLYISDLVDSINKFLNSNLKHEVFNIGGGPENTLSLLELLDTLKKLTNKHLSVIFKNWRTADQKVYISNIDKAKSLLNWFPKVTPIEGVKKVIEWVSQNLHLFY
jgi:CDP-paratose 2-epimerase